MSELRCRICGIKTFSDVIGEPCLGCADAVLRSAVPMEKCTYNDGTIHCEDGKRWWHGAECKEACVACHGTALMPVYGNEYPGKGKRQTWHKGLHLAGMRCRICGNDAVDDAIGQPYCNNFHCPRYQVTVDRAHLLPARGQP